MLRRFVFLFVGMSAFASGCALFNPGNTTSQPMFTYSPTRVRTPAQQVAPNVITYNWRGTALSLTVPLPTGPSEAPVYLGKPDSPTSFLKARALADQFGIAGIVYYPPGGGEGCLIVDGNRRLRVQSDYHFTYYPNHFNYWIATTANQKPANAEEQIADFMQEFGFDEDYTVSYSDLYGAYFALPLTPEGFPLRYPHFGASGFMFRFNQDGIVSVDANLMTYESAGTYPIISAEEALQIVLGPDPVYGTLDGFVSLAGSPQAWIREYPFDETITFYGWMNSVPSAEGGEPLISLDSYVVTGNTSGIAAEMPDTFVEAIGQFHTEDSTDFFVLDSWQARAPQEGWLGTLELQGDQVVLVTSDHGTLLMPDVPADVPLPLESVYALGVTVDDTFEWNSFDLRMVNGGGGGGGGGLGFYDLNLSGTPVPLPTVATLQPLQTQAPETSDAPTATVDGVELVYLIPYQSYALPNNDFYVQPMWYFTGHYSRGNVFEVFVQALRSELLSPEILTVEPPG